ncbi:MAG TPA: hypothetical protein VEH31_03230 [Streptosporangiaceae bacterium]|nr:hypothetical protein [Streptosporangiaceae bacterium]
MRACICLAETLSHRAKQVDLRTADLGDMARPFSLSCVRVGSATPGP